MVRAISSNIFLRYSQPGIDEQSWNKWFAIKCREILILNHKYLRREDHKTKLIEKRKSIELNELIWITPRHAYELRANNSFCSLQIKCFRSPDWNVSPVSISLDANSPKHIQCNLFVDLIHCLLWTEQNSEHS